ncbi:MAG: HD domain-containing phosphohydrolase [Balneolaceae bacterium]|nr:HD domain-containing phosphohydrolase [Balneolaceae bacterium]
MIKDVKTYFQTVASRLSNAFTVEEFDTEQELEFWSLAAEHVSRKVIPNFIDIVRWVDLLYHAPVHFVYKKENGNKLTLYRRQVLVDNIRHIAGSGEELSEKERQQVREYEEQLENLEKRIAWNEDFLSIGISSHTIGQCEHIPLYDDEHAWGVYCVGPYVQSPDSIKAKLPIVSRMLSNWLVNLEESSKKATRSYEKRAGEVAGNLGTGTLNIDRIANLMIGYLARMNNARFGGMIEQKGEHIEFLAKHKLEEESISWLQEAIGPYDTLEMIQAKFDRETNPDSQLSSLPVMVKQCRTETTRAFLFLGMPEPPEGELNVESRISGMLRDLLAYRRQNSEITDKLIDTYYRMLRAIEKESKRTYYHTPRMMELAKRFGSLFELDPDEQERLILTAKLHDVGYIVTQQLDDRMTMGAELEHPFIGAMVVESLPVHEDVKKGIQTHHEWINGSGTPQGLEGEEIPWTGKIIGLFEFINEFIESNQDDKSRDDEEWLQLLQEEIIERAENQFDMVLVPTAIELIQTLGWQGCCRLGTETEED